MSLYNMTSTHNPAVEKVIRGDDDDGCGDWGGGGWTRE